MDIGTDHSKTDLSSYIVIPASEPGSSPPERRQAGGELAARTSVSKRSYKNNIPSDLPWIAGHLPATLRIAMQAGARNDKQEKFLFFISPISSTPP